MQTVKNQNASRPFFAFLYCKRPLKTYLVVYNLYGERVTAVWCTLQRLQMCSRAMIAPSTWNEWQLIDIFYPLLAASICCHRGRHRCDTVIHASLQPTRGLSLKANLIFCVCPFRGTPTTHSEGLLLRVGVLPCAPTYNRGMVQHVVFNRLGLHSHTNAARRPQCSMQPVLLCKRPPITASNSI